MASDPATALQQGIYDLLSNDATLKSLTADPVPIYSHVPQAFWEDGAAGFAPYIVIGDTTGEGSETKTEHGFTTTAQIDVWSRSRSMAEVKNIGSRIVEIMREGNLTVTGHDVIILKTGAAVYMTDPEDGLTRHGALRFRVETEAQ